MTSKNETTNSPIHEFKVLHKGPRAFKNLIVVQSYASNSPNLWRYFHFCLILPKINVINDYFSCGFEKFMDKGQ